MPIAGIKPKLSLDSETTPLNPPFHNFAQRKENYGIREYEGQVLAQISPLYVRTFKIIYVLVNEKVEVTWDCSENGMGGYNFYLLESLKERNKYLLKLLVYLKLFFMTYYIMYLNYKQIMNNVLIISLLYIKIRVKPTNPHM